MAVISITCSKGWTHPDYGASTCKRVADKFHIGENWRKLRNKGENPGRVVPRAIFCFMKARRKYVCLNYYTDREIVNVS